MSNRHERRKQAKLGRFEVISLADYAKLPSGCAWEGCATTTVDPDKAGWSKMVLYSGETHTDFARIKPNHMARDCVLCPEHAGHLDRALLKFIGGSLRYTEGFA